MREIATASIFADKSFKVEEMIELLNNAYLSGRREPYDRAKNSFAPSGVGYGSGTCARKWYYDFTGGNMREEDNDATGVANMAYGSEAHKRIQGLFETAGILISAEQKLTFEDPPIYGFYDVLINWHDEQVVGEIKTTMQESFVSKKAKGKPAGYHLLQVLIYMKILELDKGFLLYENKNLQNMLIIPVTWTDANKVLIDETFDWMRTVYANWKEDKLPKRPFKSDKSPACKSCYFTEHCWKDDDGVIDLPVLKVPK